MPTIHEILPRNDHHLFRCPEHGGQCLKACRAPIDCAQVEGATTAAGVAAALNDATPDGVTFTAEAEPFHSAPLHPEPLEEELAMVARRPILAALRASGVRISKYGTMSLEPEHIGRLATAVIATFGVEAGELDDEPEQPAVLGAHIGGGQHIVVGSRRGGGPPTASGGLGGGSEWPVGTSVRIKGTDRNGTIAGPPEGTLIAVRTTYGETRWHAIESIEIGGGPPTATGGEGHATSTGRPGCPSCGRQPEDFAEGGGPCCNAACGGTWGTGCYHCHHPRFYPLTDPRFREPDSDPAPGSDDVAEPATDLTPDIPVARVFMPRVDPETGVPWCSSTDCPHYRSGGADFPPLCSILDDSPTRICEPAVRAMASATRGLEGATWEQGPTGRDELRLRDGTLLVPSGGSGAAIAPRHGIGRLPPDHELGGPGDAAEPTATRGPLPGDGEDHSRPGNPPSRWAPPEGWCFIDRPPKGGHGLYHQELRITLTISEAGRLGWSRVGARLHVGHRLGVLDGADVPLDARVYLVRRWLEPVT